MTTPSGFPISLSQMRSEFGLGLPCVFPDAFYGKGGLPGSGTLKFSDLFNRSAESPITLVGFAAKGHNLTSAASISYTADFVDGSGNPVTPLSTDFILIWCVHAGTTFNNNVGSAVGTSTGTFTKFPAGTVLTGADAAYVSAQAAYQFRGASASISLPGVNAIPDTMCFIAVALRGVNTTTPLDTTPTTASNINTGVPNPPSITPSTAGALIVYMGGAAQLSGTSGTTALTVPTGMNGAATHYKQIQMLNGTDCAAAVGLKKDWASGAVNPAVFGGSTSTANDSWAAATFAIRPA